MTDVLIFLSGFFGSLTGALIALVIVVKLFFYPLSRWSSRGVAANQTLAVALKPKVNAIRQKYNGEEQAERILGLYKKEGYKPFLPLKSVAVLLLQIPVFIGVFLAVQSGAFARESLLGIHDITQPDSLLRTQYQIINVLPFVMLVISLASIFHLYSLRAIERSQIISGVALAVGFFLILYESAAALILYWTLNIAIQWAIDGSLNRGNGAMR